MRPALRRVLFWSALSLGAVAIGAPLGIGYAMYAQARPDTSLPPLLAPLPLSPKDGAVTSLSPTLKWGGDAQGGKFVVQIMGDPTKDARLESFETRANEFTREEPFVPGAPVYWRVRAVAADGEASPWSPIWSFTPLAGA